MKTEDVYEPNKFFDTKYDIEADSPPRSPPSRSPYSPDYSVYSEDSEHEAYDERPAIFGTHPIQGDAWHLAVIDRSEGPKIHTFDRFLMTSLDHRGATGPSLVWHQPGLNIEFVGEETITVGAGTFDALHFCYGERGSNAQGSNETNDHPPYEVWVTADGEFILLKAQVTGYMMTQYELVSLEVHPGDGELN